MSLRVVTLEVHGSVSDLSLRNIREYKEEELHREHIALLNDRFVGKEEL